MVNRLITFFGEECHICKEMDPIVDKLADELNVKIIHLETWHNSKNEALRKKSDTIKCDGVPFFFNEASGKGLCGKQSEANLKKWMQGE